MGEVTVGPVVERKPGRTPCCGDPRQLGGDKHPWQLVSEDGPGDVYVCPECKAVDVD